MIEFDDYIDRELGKLEDFFSNSVGVSKATLLEVHYVRGKIDMLDDFISRSGYDISSDLDGYCSRSRNLEGNCIGLIRNLEEKAIIDQYEALVRNARKAGFHLFHLNKLHVNDHPNESCVEYNKYIRLSLSLHELAIDRYDNAKTLKSNLTKIMACALSEHGSSAYIKREVDEYFPTVSHREALSVYKLAQEILLRSEAIN